MDLELTIKNYRCFADSNPARISIRKRFTAFIGTNNAGKSSALKFFYEFRDLFKMLTLPLAHIPAAQRGGAVAFPVSSNIVDIAELFSKTNDREIEIDVRICERKLLVVL